MSKQHETKTNAVRELEAAHADFEARFFDCPEALSGRRGGAASGTRPGPRVQNPGHAGKIGGTLRVHDTRGLRTRSQEGSGGCERESRSHDQMRASFCRSPATCTEASSPVGMKKQFVTTIDETAELFERIAFSGGRIGCQVEMPLSELARMMPLGVADLTVV